MRTTKTISRLVDLFVDNTEINNWSKFDWKLQISKEIDDIVKQAKAEAWEEGYESRVKFIDDYFGTKTNIELPEPTNPYKEETKPDFNQNSMLERFGELEDEFKVE